MANASTIAAAALVVAAAASAGLAAEPAPAPPPPAILFGARPAVQQISLSPDGGRVAFIAPAEGQGSVLWVAEAAGGKPPTRVFGADGKPERLRECSWVSEKRLVCMLHMVLDQVIAGQMLDATRFIAVDADGSNPKMLSRGTRFDDQGVALGGGEIIDWLPGKGGAVMMTREYVPERKIGTRFEDVREGAGVDRVDTATLASKPVEAPKQHSYAYITDGHGNVRVMGVQEKAGATGYDSGRQAYFYRRKGSRDWKPLSTYESGPMTGFSPVAVDPVADVAYGFEKIDGRFAVVSLALDGSLRRTTVFAHPQVDVDGLWELGRDQRVVGVTFDTDRTEAVYFDRELASLAKTLGKALPGLPIVRFEDSSADGSKLLLWAGSDTDPGRYFLFDKPSKRLTELMLTRPELDGVQLAAMKPVEYRTADGTMVPAYLTLPPGSDGRNLPAIVMPHGGPTSRDRWGFDWLPQFFASRGYAVLQPNYRGSYGYGDAWYQKNGFQSWRTAISDVNDAGRWLVSQGIADASKLGIFGWSYGGYAALQSSVLDPDLFKAVVAVAPVTDLAQLVQESTRFTSHRLVREFVGEGPHVREGSPAQHADRIKAPVLLFHGEFDSNVRVQESRLMNDRLKAAGRKSELVVYPRLDHQLDDSRVRSEMLRRSDAFFRTAFKLPE